MAPRVDYCCCGCSLKTGAVSIALCHIVISMVLLSITPLSLYRMYSPAGNHTDSGNATFADGWVNNEDKEGDKRRRKNHELIDDSIKGLYILIIALFALNFIVNLFLLIGVIKGKPFLINIWIIFNSVFLMTSIVMCIINLFMTFLDPDPPLRSLGLSSLCIVATTYFIVVVNSLYQQLDHRQVSPRIKRTPQIVFIVDPPPPPDLPPPPYPSCSDKQSPPPPPQEKEEQEEEEK